ncbi:hypothetical protein ONZ45_g16695 [Pleurotus djamor]|nr:hypothetical protein ONZ45_g16695 [Pleurotus djamor]
MPQPYNLVPAQQQATSNHHRTHRTDSQKVDLLLDAIKDCNWTLGEALYTLFREVDKNGVKVPRSERCIAMVSKFLNGSSNHTVASILSLWISSSYSKPLPKHTERSATFSTSISYQDLTFAEPIITTFAAHLVRMELLKEVKAAVQPKNGLHVSSGDVGNNTQRSTESLLDDYGAGTIAKAEKVFRQHQPLAWHFLTAMATPSEGRKRDMRPPNLVVTQALSSIAFCRNSHAKLLASDFGVLLFACRTNRYIHSYASRLGLSSSHNTTYRLLESYAQRDLARLRILIQQPSLAPLLRLDNIQHQIRARDLRVGRENRMITGTATTLFLMKNVSPTALDIEAKQLLLLKSERLELTFQKLWDMIDHDRLSTLLTMQWLRTLIYCVPSLARYKKRLSKMYKDPEKGAIHRVPAERTLSFPLPTNSRNETLLSDLAQGLREIMASIDYTPDKHPNRLLPIGGDGLTFERMIQAKNILRITGTNGVTALFKNRIPILFFEQHFLVKQICEILGVSKTLAYSTLCKSKLRARTSDQGSPMGRPRLLNTSHTNTIQALIELQHTIYLDEIQDKLAEIHGIHASIPTISRVIRRLNFTRKTTSARALERNELNRSIYMNRIAGLASDLDMLMFVDEAARNRRTSARTQGWARRGARCVQRRFFVRGQRYSILPILTLDGIITYDIIHGSVTSERFLKFLHAPHQSLPRPSKYPCA